MQTRSTNTKLLIFALMMVIGAVPAFVNAGTVQASTSVQTSRYLDGTNLTDNNLAISLTADLSLDQGLFCYTSTAETRLNLRSGCALYAGYFKPLDNNDQAFSVVATRHQYVRARGSKWDFTELEAIWHLNKAANLSIAYTDDWLRRGFESYALRGNVSHQISNQFSVNLSLRTTLFESTAPVSMLNFAKASIEYRRQRWLFECSLISSDSDLREVLPFDVDKPEIGFTLTYQLY